jgi:hypothetical protein
MRRIWWLRLNGFRIWERATAPAPWFTPRIGAKVHLTQVEDRSGGVSAGASCREARMVMLAIRRVVPAGVVAAVTWAAFQAGCGG